MAALDNCLIVRATVRVPVQPYTTLKEAESHAHICAKLAEQYKSDPVLFAALTDAAAIIRDLMRDRLGASATGAGQAEIKALRAEVDRLAEALRELEEREQRDEALLRQALKALESGAWDTLRGRNAAAAILDRLGEGAMIERNRHPAGRVFNTLFGLCQVADGFIRVLSLGYLHSRLTLTVSRKATEKLISRRKKLLEQLAQSPERQERENSND